VDPLALGFIALAAVLHAGWNILLKTAGDPLRTATLGMVAVSVVLVPAALVAWWLVDRPAFPPQAWAIGVVSGVLEGLYFVTLTAAYRRGDLSVVYPLARGTALVLAVVVGVVILQEQLAPLAIAGVALLAVGLLVVQRPWRLVTQTRRDRAAAGFALLTGLVITAYTALDRAAVQQTPPWLYAALLWPVSAVTLLAVDVVRRRAIRAGRLEPIEPVDPRTAVIGGFATFGAYAFVLAALSRAPLAIVAPLRESAVVIISAWGVVRLREAGAGREGALRIAGSALVLVGAVALGAAR
jgi:drug/metabolite transporter (DMT)-like permease